jgi:hypothetical protein
MTPTHLIVSPTHWHASVIARQRNLAPDAWTFVISLPIAQEWIARCQSLGVDFAPVIVTRPA